MSSEKSYLLVKYTSSNAEQMSNDLSTNASPYINLLSKSSTADDACNPDEAINDINASQYIFNKKLNSYDTIHINYNTQYKCNDIPLKTIYEYDNNSYKTYDFSDNVKNVNIHNPIINIDADKISYVKIPTTATKVISSASKQIYTITPHEYSSQDAIYYLGDTHVKSGRTMFYEKQSDGSIKPIDTQFDKKLHLSNPNSDIAVILWNTNSNPSTSTLKDILSCNSGDYITGWSYKYYKDDGDNPLHHVDIITNCIHYDITSSLESIAPVTCPADGDWPVTNTGRTASKSCPTGYAGTVTRVCSDGQWKEPVSNCSKNTEITYCPAVASTATTLAWPKTEQSKTATQKCPSGYTGTVTRVCNADGTWNTEQRKCTEETVFDKLNNLGSISIGGTDIYLWYIIIAFIVFIVLLLIIKVKSKKEDPMEKIWKMRMMGF